MKLFLLLASLFTIQAVAEDASHIAPKSLVIIEIQEHQQKRFCLGFLLDEYNVMTASLCADASYESMRVYRTLEDCHARNNSIPIELGNYQQSNPEMPTALSLTRPVNDRPRALTAFPIIDRDEDLNCFFLVEDKEQFILFRRIVRYWDTVKNGVVEITTPTTMSLKGKPIPGAILYNSVGDVTGISFQNGQLFSPMHGFLIPFHTVALEPKREL